MTVTLRPAGVGGSGGRRCGTGAPTVPVGRKRARLHLQPPLLTWTRTSYEAASGGAAAAASGSADARLHEWMPSDLLASSTVAVVASSLYLAPFSRADSESVVPLGCRDARRRLSIATRAPLVVAGTNSRTRSPCMRGRGATEHPA